MTHKLILLAGLSGLALSQPIHAQKREQNLQSVPAAVTALSSKAIAIASSADFFDRTRADRG